MRLLIFYFWFVMRILVQEITVIIEKQNLYFKKYYFFQGSL